jgi:hypothetical protein
MELRDWRLDCRWYGKGKLGRWGLLSTCLPFTPHWVGVTQRLYDNDYLVDVYLQWLKQHLVLSLPCDVPVDGAG